MVREAIATANTLEEATARACEELGVSSTECTTEVLQLPKKGLFGKMKQLAKVKVTVESLDEMAEEIFSTAEKKEPERKAEKKATAKSQAPAEKKSAPAPEMEKKPEPVEVTEELKTKIEVARKYLNDIFSNMGVGEINVSFDVEENRTVKIALEGAEIGTVIGKRGETLDAIQYLVCLVANRLDGEYVRFTINAGNYREKREETLRNLAQRMAKKVLKTGRPSALEPMNPYERRIIHAVITDIEGVYSKSTGEEPNRKVVIKPSGKQSYRGKSDGSRQNRRGRDEYKKTAAPREEAADLAEKPTEHKAVESKTLDDNVKLYSKIEL